MNVLAIIPARGGSKGIPQKNLLSLGGKPLVARTIEIAREARLVSRVVVSTDDESIARTAREFGAEAIHRPAELSGDQASSESALLHVLKVLQENEGYRPDLIVFLQCTSPLTAAEDIDGAIDQLLKENADSVLAVAPFHYFLWKRDANGNAEGINHDKRTRPLRQNRDPEFLETGAVYVMRTEGFERARHRFFGKTALYVMPEERRLEIDEPHDFQIAEILLRDQVRQDRMRALPSQVSGVVFDFDGVFTDNSVIVSQDGEEAVACNRSDGWGISQLKQLGLPLLVLSIETNPVVRMRCAKHADTA
jgi:CMP-N-acetylneuraminic acid synthetase